MRCISVKLRMQVHQFHIETPFLGCKYGTLSYLSSLAVGSVAVMLKTF